MTVDARAMLRVTQTYLDLVVRLGEIADAPISFRGVSVIDKRSTVG